MIADDITDTNVDPGPLEYGVKYYWQVDENKSEGTVTGDVWCFRTEIWEIWVDDDYWDGGENDGHTWGIDAFDNIMTAIGRSQYGTTVHVAGGKYLERITLKNGVALIGAGADSAVIDAGGSGSVVTSASCDANTILEGFTITGGNTTSGGGMFNYDSNPTVTDCAFSGNEAGIDGGGIYNYGGIQVVTNCAFSGNEAGNNGGGMYNYYVEPKVMKVTSCTFTGNTASNNGGGMGNTWSNLPVTNCTFSGNSAEGGGGIYNYNASSPTMTNCILWGDSADKSDDEIYNSSSTPVISYSDIQGGWGGTGNIDADPCFIDAAAGNLRLRPGSPCIDAGSNLGLGMDKVDLDGDGITNEAIPLDMDGYPRFTDAPNTPDSGVYFTSEFPIVDMGAYEYPGREPIKGDINCDGVVDFKDVAILCNNWLTGTEPE